ncbi:MAG: sialate O-acetylesterase [Phycisphaeraceae bacterium]
MQRTLITLLALLLLAPAAIAEVTLPSVFGDHMVLQRDKEVRIWGKADPGEQVKISFSKSNADDSKEYRVKADAQGNWQAMLAAKPSGGDWSMLIHGNDVNNVRLIKDIVFGEVWVASGQSNMQWTVAQSANAKEEIASSDNDQIRMWTARRTVKTEPAFDVPGTWAVASPETTGNFSAVGYYFARKLQQELGVPVGILHSSWGGTPVEAWTSRDKLNTIDWAKPILQRFDTAVKVYPKAKADHEKATKRWQETRNGPANTGEKAGYAKSDFDDKQWKTMKLPQTWEKGGLPDKDGVVWFRKTIDLPAGWESQALTLSLGPIDDGDTTYVNGTQVGYSEPANRGNWQRPRNYKIDKKLVKQGKLTVAVRAVDLSGEGGLWGKPEQLTLTRADGQGKAVSLAGDWTYHLAHELNANNRPTRRPGTLFGPEHPHSPAGLFNGMIAPLVPYTIQGVIWYQGESNASRAQQYGKLFPGMIDDWRARWGQGEFPFLFVQLANYRNPTDKIVDSDWAHLRHVQLRTLRTSANLGMAVTIDIGAANNIHPSNKQDVGKRLARWALAETYGKKDLVKSGPLYQSAKPVAVDGKKSMVIGFINVGSGLSIRKDATLQGFSIAGEDGVFVVANAEIIAIEDGPTTEIRVWSDKVKDPVAVRYAWEDNPTEANLINEEGLPASPFRTDRFKGPTDGRY